MLHTYTQVGVWLDAGIARNNTRRFISINDLVDKIDNNVLIALPGLHAFTGCNYTSSFLSKEKINQWTLWWNTKNSLMLWPSLAIVLCQIPPSKHVRNMYATCMEKQSCPVRMCHAMWSSSKHMHQRMITHQGCESQLNATMCEGLGKKLDRANYFARMWNRADSQKPWLWCRSCWSWLCDWYWHLQDPAVRHSTHTE